MKFGPYSTAKYSEARGFAHDGIPAKADLLRDGKKIGTVLDEGNGGPTDAHLSREEEKALQAYVKTLPPEPSEFSDEPLTVTVDYFLGMLLEDAAIRKQETGIAKRAAKKGYYVTAFFTAKGKEYRVSAKDRIAAVEGVQKSKGTLTRIIECNVNHVVAIIDGDELTALAEAHAGHIDQRRKRADANRNR